MVEASLLLVAALVVLGVAVSAVLLFRVASIGLGRLRERMGLSRPAGWLLVVALVGGPLLAAWWGTFPVEGPDRIPAALATATYGVGGIVLGMAYGYLSRFRLLRSATPAAPGDSLQPGNTVALEGTATPAGGTLDGPVTGEPCLAYDYTVEVASASLGGRGHWQTVEAGRDEVPFDLDDGSGQVRVDPADGDLLLEDGVLVTVDGDETRRESLRDAQPLAPRPGEEDRRSAEHRLEPGATASVVGDVVDASSTGRGDGQAGGPGPGPQVGDSGAGPQVGDSGAGPQVGGCGATLLVSDSDLAGLRRGVRLVVLVGGPLGAAVAVAGYRWLLGVTGVL